MNTWYEKELTENTLVASEWMPPDAELVSFIDRLIYLLRMLEEPGTAGSGKHGSLVSDLHWWSTFMQGYQFAGHLLANSSYRLRMCFRRFNIYLFLVCYHFRVEIAQMTFQGIIYS